MAESVSHTKACGGPTASTTFTTVRASIQQSEEMNTFLLQRGMTPTEDDITRYENAFAKLRSTLLGEEIQVIRSGDGPLVYSSSGRGLSLVIALIGSYALNVWDSTSGIDCLCVGSCSSNTFYSMAHQRLRREANQGLRFLLADKSGSGSTFEVEIQGVKLNLQYCQSRFAESWSQLCSEQLPESHILNIPIPTLERLNSYRDVEYLLRTIPDLESFWTAHSMIKAWARERGLYSTKHGYLGDQHITFMLSRICKRLSVGGVIPSPTVIARAFFAFYATFDFERDFIFDKEFHNLKPRYQRSIQEPIVILTMYSPVVNVAANVSTHTLRTLTKELKRADELMAAANMTWPRLMGQCHFPADIKMQSGAAIDFLQGFESFIRIDIRYWGASTVKCGKLVRWIDGKCPHIIADINHNLPVLHTRIWPSRFILATGNDQEAIDDYRSFYLIGLAKTNETTAHRNTERRTTQAALHTTIETFTAQIHNDTRYDPNSSFIDISLIKQSDLRLSELRLDSTEWGHIADDQTIESPPDEDDDEGGEAMNTTIQRHPHGSNSKSTNIQPPKPKHATSPTDAAPAAPKPKLRPASDILSRLRWDPSLSSEPYTIGYLDRFAGVKEIPLEAWKGDSSEEDFVPGHRILWFRRVSDGVLVWERERRVDMVFGSGSGWEGSAEAEV